MRSSHHRSDTIHTASPVLAHRPLRYFIPHSCTLPTVSLRCSLISWCASPRHLHSFPTRRSSDLDKQASHFVHIPGLSYSGVKSPTECQQSLFESHFASRQSLSDCPVAF